MFSTGCYMIMLFLSSSLLTSQECCINSHESEALHGRRGLPAVCPPGLVENVVVTGGCIPLSPQTRQEIARVSLGTARNHSPS